MKYIYLTGNIVSSIVFDEDPVFPGVLVVDRFPLEFLNSTIKIEENIEVDLGWLYDFESQTFSEPVVEPEPDLPEPEPEPIDPEPTSDISDIQYALEILLGGHDDELDSIISSGA